MTPQPGDVLAVRTSGWASTMIRLGAALAGKPNLSNHIAVVHHTDGKGTTWAIEGRPGGAGWRDAGAYLTSRQTLTNAAQPKTTGQRSAICATMEALIGSEYSWVTIAADAMDDLRLPVSGWDRNFHGTVDGGFVCSNLAVYAYLKAGVPCPDGGRGTQPAAWDEWILTRGWEHP